VSQLSFAERIAHLAETEATAPVLRVAAVDGTEVVVTWPELHRRSTQIARGLQARGTTEGSRVAVALRNSPEFVTTVLAAWKLGAVPVPERVVQEGKIMTAAGVSAGIDMCLRLIQVMYGDEAAQAGVSGQEDRSHATLDEESDHLVLLHDRACRDPRGMLLHGLRHKREHRTGSSRNDGGGRRLGWQGHPSH